VLTLAVFASSVAYGAAALALACRLYDSERLLSVDDASLGLRAWLRHLILGPKRAGAAPSPAAPAPPPPPDAGPTAGHALALFAVAVLVLLVFAPIQKWNLPVGLALFEWVGLLGLTAAYARGSGQPLAAVLRLRKPAAGAVVGALLIGSSAWLVIGLLVEWVLPPPKELVEELRHAITPKAGRGAFLLALLLTAVTPAICEEALFRGPILRGLRSRLAPLGAAVVTGLLFGIYHGSVWRFVPAATLGIMLSAIALAADSIVPAMVAHFANNACIIALASAGFEESDASMPVRDRLVLIAVGSVGLLAGTALLARSARRTRRVSAQTANDASNHRL
jgi:sodium transport system permease protein